MAAENDREKTQVFAKENILTLTIAEWAAATGKKLTDYDLKGVSACSQNSTGSMPSAFDELAKVTPVNAVVVLNLIIQRSGTHGYSTNIAGTALIPKKIEND